MTFCETFRIHDVLYIRSSVSPLAEVALAPQASILSTFYVVYLHKKSNSDTDVTPLHGEVDLHSGDICSTPRRHSTGTAGMPAYGKTLTEVAGIGKR